LVIVLSMLVTVAATPGTELHTDDATPKTNPVKFRIRINSPAQLWLLMMRRT
jgi:hypothetical protein